MEASLSIPVPLRVLSSKAPLSERPWPVLIALHGYAQSADMLLPMAERMAPEGFLVVAVEGPFSTLLPGQAAGPQMERGFHWGVSPRNDENRAAHRAAVEKAIEWSVALGGDPDRISLLGFSQPCSFSYRLALEPPHGRPLHAVIGIAGGVPGEWLGADERPEGSESSRATAALHVSTREDPFYPLEKVALFEDHLRRRFRTAALHLFDGGHRIPKAAIEPIRALLTTAARA
jgi:predicted esterase